MKRAWDLHGVTAGDEYTERATTMNKSREEDNLDQLVSAMKNDWDARARENARWYINTLSLAQSDEEFDLSGRREFEGVVLPDLAILTDRRDPKTLRMLEIGCGIGRMTRFLTELFGEVYAVDVSGEMIRQAEERLGSNRDVYFRETNGVDFAFPDEFFDVILSAYVFGHVPTAAAIESNIRDAFRVLKPTGTFKFVTSAIQHADFVQMPKDTWGGAPFPESAIRSLALDLGAQLLGVHGDGTQYCWSVLRKRRQIQQQGSSALQILSIGHAEDLTSSDFSPRQGDTNLGIILQGVNYETVDINSATVDFRGKAFVPYYTGPTAVSPEAVIYQKPFQFESDRIQVSVRIPADEVAGEGDLRVRLANGLASPPAKIFLPPVQAPKPAISLVINAVDKGLDVHARGPKSRIKILFEHLGAQASVECVNVLINNCWIKPESISFLPANGLWEVTTQLPADTVPGVAVVQVKVEEQVSTPFTISLKY